MKPYMNIEQYAEMLGVSKFTVRDAVTKYGIHHSRVGRLIRFSEEDIEANRAEWHKPPIAAPVVGVTNIRSRRRRAA